MSDPQWLDGCEDRNDPTQIRLMHHDARWRQEFEQTRSSILQSCEGRVVAVEHIGSTAIGGLIARPIIDAVAVVADPVDLAEASLLIEGLNFRAIELPDWANARTPLPGTRLLEKPRHGPATHRVFVVGQGSALLEEAVRLRDHFRDIPEIAVDFEACKVNAWRESDGDAVAYHSAMQREFAKRISAMGDGA